MYSVHGLSESRTQSFKTLHSISGANEKTDEPAYQIWLHSDWKLEEDEKEICEQI